VSSVGKQREVEPVPEVEVSAGPEPSLAGE